MLTRIELKQDELNEAIREYLSCRGVDLDIKAVIDVEKSDSGELKVLINQNTKPKVQQGSFFGMPVHEEGVRSRAVSNADRDIVNDR